MQPPTKFSSPVGFNSDQQSTARLRIEQKAEQKGISPIFAYSIDIHFTQTPAVGRRESALQVLSQELRRSIEDRHVAKQNLRINFACPQHFQHVPGQTEAADIRCCLNAEFIA